MTQASLPGPSWPRAVYALALLLAILPLWVSHSLPIVDLPQHLHLISVLHRLDDPTTIFPRLYAERGTLTPYLGYYYLVSGLSWLMPLEMANRLFLSAYVAGFALALGFLLRSLGRPAWPSLLALPFAYGDSFGWGFVNYVAALPLALLTCGLFVRSIDAAQARARTRAAVGMGAALISVLLFHVQAFAFLAVALPWLLVTTQAPDVPGRTPLARWLRARRGALLGVAPAVLLFVLWVGLRLGEPSEVEAGAAWKAWGPMLSPQNLAWKSPGQNLAELPRVVANLFRDGSDRLGVTIALVIAVGAALAGAWPAARARAAHRSSLRLWGLGLLALALYFLLPFDIRGYMYYLNTRFAHLAAPLLLVALVPPLTARFQRVGVLAATGGALVLAITLGRGFRAFDAEAAPYAELAPLAGRSPLVMGLIFDAGSRVATHPVHLHAAATIARLQGGAPNFSFALTPHSPLRYQGTPPPTFASEWRPNQFRWELYGEHYDAFVVRGAHPSRVFGPHLGAEVEIAGERDGVWLVRRTAPRRQVGTPGGPALR